MTNNPAQYFFSFNSTLVDAKTIGQREAKVPEFIRLVLIPRSRNTLLIRIENLSEYQTASINVADLCKALYRDANEGVDPSSLEITEMNLTGNMPLAEMKERKIKWRTEDEKQT
jgi:hypothetical protein